MKKLSIVTEIDIIAIKKFFDKDVYVILTNKYDNQFKEDIKSLSEFNNPFGPRRLLGNYLTFLVNEENDQYSVLFRASDKEFHTSCDCQHFTQTNNCRHVAFCVNWVNIQLSLKDHDDFQKVKSPYAFGKNIVPTRIYDEATRSLPYIFYNAKDFSYYRIVSQFPINVKSRVSNSNITVEKKETEVQVTHNYAHSKIVTYFRVNEQNDLAVTCDCKNCFIDHACEHAIESFRYISLHKPAHFFIEYCNFDSEKALLLAEYGLTLEDPEANRFKYTFSNFGKITIAYVPDEFAGLSKIKRITENLVKFNPPRPSFLSNVNNQFKIGLYFDFNHDENSNMPISLCAFRIETSTDKYIKMSIHDPIGLSFIEKLNARQRHTLEDFSFLKFREIFNNEYYSASFNTFTNNFFRPVQQTYLKYFFEKIEEHWQDLVQFEYIFNIQGEKNFAKNNLIPVRLELQKITARFTLSENEKFYTILTEFYTLDDNKLFEDGAEYRIFGNKLLLVNNCYYLIESDGYEKLLQELPTGKLNISKKTNPEVIQSLFLPLCQAFDIEMPPSLLENTVEYPFHPIILLKDNPSNQLIITPQFGYGEFVLSKANKDSYYIQSEEGDKLLLRDKQSEKMFWDYIANQNNQFTESQKGDAFILSGDLLMKNNWFITFTKQMMDDGITILGMQDLQKFKFNTSTPKWNMSITSNIDWFDVKVTASWDKQVISLKDLKKAILNNQNFVVLDDGSFGMLPQEWITKYSKLFKFGEDNNDAIKVNKKLFNIIEILFNEIEEEKIINEINEKKRKLLDLSFPKTLPIPKNIKATLRPYQETGYKWMQVLDHISWGGCLADDMGLGKTLQTITFLSYLRDKQPGVTSLIICPTSLIFNWEDEFNKFAPDIKYHLYYGVNRSFSNEYFDDYDVIITSYGLIRNDIEFLKSFDWEYVILDESQAIKNPEALSTKAVHLLKARNKFILSGTPLQNNTFDIFAQFHFLNPGMFGNKEFFKTEFANKIDKEGDEYTSNLLRSMIKPFMLRRTKKEVAPDLPDKTEVVLWCQMDKNQKIVYDEYKDYYRHAIMNKIEKDGIAKSGVYILEGLLRLRQICDDPRLVNENHKGVKIKELMREITENSGNHKILVFSQFTEMLSLIRKELDSKNLEYCYLDGSTSLKDRKIAVDSFQTDEKLKIFLISLKAGGVGLNLTAADYVYIVDPWWNPAVEQQAIDRTHRIGQKNNIFAYKMICKDSVEEKIMELQNKKLKITEDIIQEDNAFFKTLTREDITYLFS